MIKVKRGTRDRLEELKVKMGARSYDEVINALLDGYVKTAVEELKKLNGVLTAVRQGE